jgi:hypothetical protein
MMNFLKESESLSPQFNNIQKRALITGVVGLVLLVVGTFLDPEQFFRSYLVAYIFWIEVALGCLAIVMIHHIAGGAWGVMIQRLLEAGMMTLPLMALLFVPLIFGLSILYPWARPEEVAHDAILQHKSLYLNVPFFLVRTVIYFVIWIGLAYWLRKWSLEQDQRADSALASRFRRLSAPGVLLFGLTITFASVDWMMSLEPHWFSTIYGIMFGVGAYTSAFAFVIILVLWLAKRKPFLGVISTQNINDLGNFLLAGVMLWAYIAFSQYLIIWSGNLPEEIPWYLHRTEGGWQWIGLALILLHFILPLLFLLSRATKRSPEMLTRIAGVVIFMRLVDLFWLIIPAFHPGKLYIHWLDIVAFIGLSGIWIAVFVRQLKGKSLLPLHDPRLEETFTHEQQEVPSHAH